MSFAVFAAVLFAALLHASWNAVVKTGASKITGMVIVALGSGVIGALVVVGRPMPALGIWPWLVASGLIRTAYMLFLSYAYEQGDLSRVYPIARGAAPLFVLLAGAFLLADVISARELTGILVLGAGILLMARGAFSNGESRRLVWFALGSALATAAYSIVDWIGARLSGDPVTFVSWALLRTAVFFVPVALVRHGGGVMRATGRVWGMGAVASVSAFVAYGIVVWAMTQAPIALVTALRETSILFAVMIGWWFFGERMDRGKMVAAGLIVGGVVLTRF